MREEPLCRPCQAQGFITHSREVDHIVPRAQGGQSLRDNLQGICVPCHRDKTNRESKAAQWGNIWAATIPTWLRPSAIPLTIVCGPAGSGKSTWCRMQARPGDVIIDLDEIFGQLNGCAPHEAEKTMLNQALLVRNNRLGALSRARQGRAYFIVSSPKATDRQRWADLLQPKRVVVLTVPAAVCIGRIKADHARAKILDMPHRRDQLYRLPGEWWQSYTPRPGDDVIKDFALKATQEGAAHG